MENWKTRIDSNGKYHSNLISFMDLNLSDETKNILMGKQELKPIKNQESKIEKFIFFLDCLFPAIFFSVFVLAAFILLVFASN